MEIKNAALSKYFVAPSEGTCVHIHINCGSRATPSILYGTFPPWCENPRGLRKLIC